VWSKIANENSSGVPPLSTLVVRESRKERALPGVKPWMTSLQQRLVKTGGRLVKHARYYWLMLTESHLTWRLFGSMGPADRCAGGGDWVAGGR